MVDLSTRLSKRGFILKTEKEFTNKEGLFDGDFTLTLWKDNRWVATGGISFGLHRYFGEFNLFESFDWLEQIKEHAHKRYGVVQIQAMPLTGSVRAGVPYHDLLMEGLECLARELGSTLNFFVPAHLNYWYLTRISNHEPREEVEQFLASLKKNYDAVAARHGFSYDAQSGLFLK